MNKESSNRETKVSIIGWGQGHKGAVIGIQEGVWVQLTRTEWRMGYTVQNGLEQSFTECVGIGLNKMGGGSKGTQHRWK